MKGWKLALASGCLAAVLAPLVTLTVPVATPWPVSDFPGWPATFEGRALKPLPLTPREATLAEGFPGRVGRFHDGRREVVLRWVARPTRKLHPAVQCFEAHGYDIEYRPLWRGEEGLFWTEIVARRDGVALRVREAVRDEDGGQWADVSAWYWAALFERTASPWWSVIVAEPWNEERKS